MITKAQLLEEKEILKRQFMGKTVEYLRSCKRLDRDAALRILGKIHLIDKLLKKGGNEE